MRKLLLSAFLVLPFVMCEVTTTVETDPTPSVTPFIYNARFADEVDNDGDGYPSTFDLEFDPDVQSGYTATIYVAVYGKFSTETTYSLITTTSDITISGATTTYYGVSLQGGSHGAHDFMLYLYDADTDELLDTYGPSDDSDLNDHLEETPAEDVVLTAYIYDARFANEVDYDSDGYPSTFDLQYDPDVTGDGTMTIYVELWGRITGNSTWNYIGVSNNHTLVSDATVWYDFSLYGGSHGRHDFLLKVYHASTDVLLDSYGPSDDSDLSGHYEEQPAED